MSAPLNPQPIDPVIQERRLRVFIVLAGLFLGTLAMLNILGISRFITLAKVTMAGGTPDEWQLAFQVAVGVLPYPLTFFCTDLISEFYGRRRANFVVFTGFLLNIWVVFILWLGGVLPGAETIDPATGQIARDAAGRLPVFYEVRALTFGAVAASMIAYLAAQLVDVQVFHFWKKLTRGKHLWLRNNGSTLVSQLVDTTAVILITHFATEQGLPLNEKQSVWFQLVVGCILAGYAFKLLAALVDTIPLYLAVRWLSGYLRIDPTAEHFPGEDGTPIAS